MRSRRVQFKQRPVARGELPPGALLQRYVDSGAFTDCYVADIDAPASFEAFVEAFYTSFPFKMERLALWCIGKGSSDADARRLARGEAESFAAWSVEARAPDQVLMCDFMSRTRSWLMISPKEEGGARLYFGTAILPVGIGARRGRLGFPFNALLGFHHIYAQTLLGAARSRIEYARRR